MYSSRYLSDTHYPFYNLYKQAPLNGVPLIGAPLDALFALELVEGRSGKGRLQTSDDDVADVANDSGSDEDADSDLSAHQAEKRVGEKVVDGSGLVDPEPVASRQAKVGDHGLDGGQVPGLAHEHHVEEQSSSGDQMDGHVEPQGDLFLDGGVLEQSGVVELEGPVEHGDDALKGSHGHGHTVLELVEEVAEVLGVQRGCVGQKSQQEDQVAAAQTQNGQVLVLASVRGIERVGVLSQKVERRGEGDEADKMVDERQTHVGRANPRLVGCLGGSDGSCGFSFLLRHDLIRIAKR